MKKNKSVYIMFILLQSLLYGIGNPLTKIAFGSVSVFWCLTFRFVLAFAVFFLFFGRRIAGELKKAKIRDYLPASLCMAAAYISVNLALKWTTATNVGFLMALPVIFAPALACIVLRERYDRRHIPAQILVVVGLYLLCFGEDGFAFGRGEACALITALSVAGALVYGERAMKDLSAVTISAAQAGMTAVISLAAAVAGEKLTVAEVSWQAWGVIIYLALGCTCVAYLLQNTAVANISSQMVSMLQTSQPVATAVCAYLILGEKLTVRGYVGAGTILLCIIAESVSAARSQEDYVQEGEE